MSAFGEFLKFVADCRSLMGWIVKAGFAAPLLPLILNLGPPFEGGTPTAGKAAVALLTAIVQMFALTSAFAFGVKWADEGRAVLKKALVFGIGWLLAYVTMLLLLTEVPPSVPQRYVAGFIRTSQYMVVLDELGDPEKAKDALGRNPLRIWEPWTVYVSYVLVNLTWLTFFGVLTFYVGAFVMVLRKTNAASLPGTERSIYELRLPKNIQRDLEAAGIITISDLLTRTREELLRLPRIGEARVAAIVARVQECGWSVRGQTAESSPASRRKSPGNEEP